jgi:hypothetical protein
MVEETVVEKWCNMTATIKKPTQGMPGRAGLSSSIVEGF